MRPGLRRPLPLRLVGFDAVLLGRVLFAAGCGAAGGAWLAVAFVSPDPIVVAGTTDGILGAAAGLATVRAIDRPTPAANLAAAAVVVLAKFTILRAV